MPCFGSSTAVPRQACGPCLHRTIVLSEFSRPHLRHPSRIMCTSCVGAARHSHPSPPGTPPPGRTGKPSQGPTRRSIPIVSKSTITSGSRIPLEDRTPMPSDFLPRPREEEARVEPPPTASRNLALYVHVVRWKEETLSFIAQWYTASWKNWEALAKANPELDPDRIMIGDRDPDSGSLLKTRKPMPSEFLPTAVSKKPCSLLRLPENPSRSRIVCGPSRSKRRVTHRRRPRRGGVVRP